MEKVPKRVINFAAGPSKIAEEVLKTAQDELLVYQDTGVSVMEMSHRSAAFTKILDTVEQDLREIMDIPSNYKVLFMHGGMTTQFAAIPMNLCDKLGECVADYIVTGAWSSKAAKEAQKYCKVNLVLPKMSSHTSIPDQSTWKLTPGAKFVYYCDNETIHGVEFPSTPQFDDPSVVVVCDMTSNFLSRPIDVRKYGVITASTQKNVGMAGLAIVIVREDLIGKGLSITPGTLDWKVMAENKSCYNTPPCYAIYMAGLCLKWIKARGGLQGMHEAAIKRSQLLYKVIDESKGFYLSPTDKSCRSRVTVPFRVGNPPDPELEKRFIAEAAARGMVELKGHRSVGGCRASIFNAMSVEETKVLADFMLEFALQHNKSTNELH